MNLKDKLFPAKNPAVIRVYGTFNRELLERVEKQICESFKQEKEPDGFILLIDSLGGDLLILLSLMSIFTRIGLPLMGLAENEARSCGAELLLSCHYRTAAPFAKILFHHGKYTVIGSEFLNPEVLRVITANKIAVEEGQINRFANTTGQSIETTRAIYLSDDIMPASRACEVGIIHEITDEVYLLPKKIILEELSK